MPHSRNNPASQTLQEHNFPLGRRQTPANIKKKCFTQNLYQACQLLQMIFQRCGVYKASQQLLSKPCKSVKYYSDTELWIIQSSKTGTVDFSQRQQSGSKYITVSWQTTDWCHWKAWVPPITKINYKAMSGHSVGK